MGIETFIERYNSEFKNAIEHIEITDNSGNMLNYHVGIELSVDLLLEIQTKNHRIYVVGNGGSAAIASHAAIDFLKNGNIPATTFNDASLLTCISNDYGYENVFVKPIEMLAREGDLVICISSSGNSANIIKAANIAKNLNKKLGKVIYIAEDSASAYGNIYSGRMYSGGMGGGAEMMPGTTNVYKSVVMTYEIK